MQYRLRTLLILLAVMPPLVAGAWWGWREWQDSRERQELDRAWREAIDARGGTVVIHPDFAFPTAASKE